MLISFVIAITDNCIVPVRIDQRCEKLGVDNGKFSLYNPTEELDESLFLSDAGLTLNESRYIY